MDGKSKTDQSRRRTILNWDGESSTLYRHAPVAAQDHVRDAMSCMTAVKIDALFVSLCTGHVFMHDTKVGSLIGEDVEAFENVVIWRLAENARNFKQQGQDFLKLCVEATRRENMEIFASLRMNDVHDSGDSDQLGTFKRSHPQYLQGEAVLKHAMGKPYKFSSMTAFDYAVRQVRDFKLAVIQDTLDRYDVDGIELDWTRSPIAFKPGEESAHLDLMTEFTREIRRRVDTAAEKRGRALYLTLSVPASLEYCLKIGLDVRTWLADGLFDVLTVNGPMFDVRLNELRQLTRNVGCQLFSRMIRSFDNLFNSADVLRAATAVYHMDGVDGIYLFNWRPYLADAPIDELSDPKALARTDKHYILAKRPDTCPEKIHTVLPPMIPVEPLPKDVAPKTIVTVPLRIADDVTSAVKDDAIKQITLTARVMNLCPETDVLVFKLNDQTLGEPHLDNQMSSCQLTFQLAGPPLRRGENELALILEKRNPRIRGKVVLTDVELLIRYK